MSEEKKNLTIEDEINEKLTGDAQKNALDFVAYMRANGMTSDAEHSNAFRYYAKWVCILCVYPDDNGMGWTIFDNPLSGQYDDFPVDDDLKEFAWAHVNICGQCGCPSKPGIRKTIFGKEFDNVCTSEVAFRNPDAETSGKIKQMIEVWKNCIDEELKK
jgi:hypothetical protein